MKIGDRIAYISISETVTTINEINWGYIYDTDDTKIGVARLNSFGPKILWKGCNSDFYCPITRETSDKVKYYFLEIIDEKIEVLRARVKTLTSEEKDELVKNKFNEIKKRINATAETMLNPTDESQWINCLKEICQLKKQLFSIKIKDLDNVHKQNGSVRWQIRRLEEFRERVVNFNFEDLT